MVNGEVWPCRIHSLIGSLRARFFVSGWGGDMDCKARMLTQRQDAAATFWGGGPGWEPDGNPIRMRGWEKHRSGFGLVRNQPLLWPGLPGVPEYGRGCGWKG